MVMKRGPNAHDIVTAVDTVAIRVSHPTAQLLTASGGGIAARPQTIRQLATRPSTCVTSWAMR
jgi:hypothetical protein